MLAKITRRTEIVCFHLCEDRETAGAVLCEVCIECPSLAAANAQRPPAVFEVD